LLTAEGAKYTFKKSTGMISFLVFIGFLLILLYRVYRCLPGHSTRRAPPSSPLSVLVVLGSGGHTGEIMPIVAALTRWKHFRSLTAVAAATDRLSFGHPLLPAAATKLTIPRAREVGQSYFTSFFSTVVSFCAALRLLSRRPDLLLVNGPGVCFPVVLGFFIGNVLGLTTCSIVFIESFCRVTSLSLTGRLIYPLCDIFYVCWPELLQLRKRAQLLDQFGLFKEKGD
jgi:beta-1,4-N-acetylglucosaminyltransferase